MPSECAVEAEIRTKGLTAPRLTPDLINATILAEQYYVFPGTTLTVCALTLRNGFCVVGESAAASPENFDASWAAASLATTPATGFGLSKAICCASGCTSKRLARSK